MIYDEGWEVAVGGKVFFAFSKFEMVPDGHGGQTNVSHCDETLIGWYRDSTRTRWGCYHGKKRTRDVAPSTPRAATRAGAKKAALVSKDSILDYALGGQEQQ